MALEELRLPPVAITSRVLDPYLWEVTAYFVANPDPEPLNCIAMNVGRHPFVIETLPDRNWVIESQRMLPPLEIGRFWVHSSASGQKTPGGLHPLCVEASEAFGTGRHATTQGCLMAIDHLATCRFRPTGICDLGCGTAILAMASARCWPAQAVIATDRDERAIATARATLEANEMTDRVSLAVADGFDHPIHRQNRPYDLIMANLLLGAILGLAKDLAAHCRANGRIVLAGLLADQADQARAACQETGFALERECVLDGWSTLIMRKT